MFNVSFVTEGNQMLECFKLRNLILVETYKYLDNKSQLLFDEYDALPNNHNVFLTNGNQIQGTVRITMGGKHAPTPVDKYYDFSSIIGNCSYFSGSMLCCSPGSQSASHWLIVYAYMFANYHSIDYIVACVNPFVENLFKKYKFKRAANPFNHKDFPQPILPMYIPLESIKAVLGDLMHLFITEFADKKLVVCHQTERSDLSYQEAIAQKFVPVKLVKDFVERRKGKSTAYAGPERRKQNIYKPGDKLTEIYYAGLTNR